MATPLYLRVCDALEYISASFNNQIPNLYFFVLVFLSKNGLQHYVSFYLYVLPRESNQQTFEGF